MKKEQTILIGLVLVAIFCLAELLSHSCQKLPQKYEISTNKITDDLVSCNLDVYDDEQLIQKEKSDSEFVIISILPTVNQDLLITNFTSRIWQPPKKKIENYYLI